MKITKTKLKKLIIEVLAGGLPEEDPSAEPAPKQAADVARATGKMEKTGGLAAVLSKINNRVELEQFLLNTLKSVNVKPGDMYIALTKAARAVKSEGA